MPHPTLPRTLGFRWGLPCLLSTPLSIPEEVSRVRVVGLKRDGLGGVFLPVLPTLCGFPEIAEGRAGLPLHPL